MDKISFIVPVYNVEPYLSRCVDSLLNQTYENIELILVDDCSPDNSKSIMESYSKKDSRIKCIFQPENKGVSAARNKGLEMATGDWIAFCDGDDWYLPEFCEEMLNSAKENGSDYIVCNYQLVSDNRPSITVDSVSAIKEDLSVRNVIACGSMSSCCHLFKKELFQLSNATYPEGIGHSEELPVVPVLAKYSKGISVVDKPLYCYYQRSYSASSASVLKDFEDELLTSLKIMEEALGNEFKQESEFRSIYILLYGEILNMCKKKYSKKDIFDRIKKYESSHPDYKKNVYYKRLGFTKRIFLCFERRRFYILMKVLSKIHSILCN